MCERASVRVNYLSKYSRFRWRGSGRVSRMLSDVELVVIDEYTVYLNTSCLSGFIQYAFETLIVYFRDPRSNVVFVSHSQYGYVCRWGIPGRLDSSFLKILIRKRTRQTKSS